MNLKKLKIISPFIIFGLECLIHFLYEWFPNIITSFLAPVNESIYEHMKMIYTAIIIYSIIEYFIFRKLNINVLNKSINPFITGLSNIFIFLAMYLPLKHIINDNMIITFIILFISNAIASFISYKLLLHKQIVSDKLGIILTLLIYIPFIYFTYNPIQMNLFYDKQNNTYGITK